MVNLWKKYDSKKTYDEYLNSDHKLRRQAIIISHILERHGIKKLNESGCPAGKVLDMKEALNDQLVEDTDMVITSDGPDDRKIKMTGFPVKLSDTPARLFRSPPKLGEHTEEILSKIKN